MSAARLSDRELLAELLRLADAILARPADAPCRALDLSVIGDDLARAVARPSSPHVNAAEAILFAALQQLAGSTVMSQLDVYRFAFLAQHAVPLVRDHFYFEVLRS